MDSKHELYMKRCIELAQLGMGNTAPNPMVGSVVVHNDRIIGEGYHQAYGKPHAEVNAIQSVERQDLLKESTLYVSLEPCSHFGKTPPCANLIVQKGIPRVVIGSADPNPLVNGKGIEILRKGGCEVISPILEADCTALNRRFFTYQQKKRPYIILKWAETSDGFIDKLRQPNEKPSWITNEEARMLVHKWRTEEQAIMIGTNTALLDNPQLTARLWNGRNPLRIVLDNHLRLPKHLHVFDSTVPTLVFTSKKAESALNLEYVPVDFTGPLLNAVWQELYKRGISSVIVEGGSFLLNSVIESQIWDEARVFVGKDSFLTGVKAPSLQLRPDNVTKIGDSALKIFFNNRT